MHSWNPCPAAAHTMYEPPAAEALSAIMAREQLRCSCLVCCIGLQPLLQPDVFCLPGNAGPRVCCLVGVEVHQGEQPATCTQLLLHIRNADRPTHGILHSRVQQQQHAHAVSDANQLCPCVMAVMRLALFTRTAEKPLLAGCCWLLPADEPRALTQSWFRQQAVCKWCYSFAEDLCHPSPPQRCAA